MLQAAFELLQVLMHHDTAHLSQIVGLLNDLHYDLRRPGILGHWQYNASAPNIIRCCMSLQTVMVLDLLSSTLGRRAVCLAA